VEQGEWYTPNELIDLPELCVGQADSMVGESDTHRVWWGRTEDSPPVSIETYNVTTRMWETTYEGSPQRVRINYVGTVDIIG
jgi:hypothetical protein